MWGQKTSSGPLHPRQVIRERLHAVKPCQVMLENRPLHWTELSKWDKLLEMNKMEVGNRQEC